MRSTSRQRPVHSILSFLMTMRTLRRSFSLKSPSLAPTC